MFLLDGAVVTSPSDLTLASKCEYAFAVQLDHKLGKNMCCSATQTAAAGSR